MKKIITLILAAYGAFVALPVLAAGSLGTVDQTVSVGQTITYDLGPSSTGRWFTPSLSNSNSKIAVAVNIGGTLYIKGLKTGTTSVKACTEIQNDNCLTVKITVSASVLGAVAPHMPGTWVKSGKTIYYVSGQGLIPVTTWQIFVDNGGESKLVKVANDGDLSLALLPFMTLNDPRVQN